MDSILKVLIFQHHRRYPRKFREESSSHWRPKLAAKIKTEDPPRVAAAAAAVVKVKAPVTEVVSCFSTETYTIWINK